MKKMTSLLLPLLFSSALFAHTTQYYNFTNVECNPIKLSIPNKGEVLINLKLNSDLEVSGNFLPTFTNLSNGQNLMIKEFKSVIDHKNAVENYEKTNCGIAGCFKTVSTVYSVKFDFSAAEALGIEVNGCIAHNVSKVSAYTTCIQHETTGNRFIR